MLTATRTLVAALAALVVAGVAATAVPAASGLDAAERATLLSMREEEKLAHDVYLALAAETGAPIFTQIAASEARHEQAVERALAAYGVSAIVVGHTEVDQVESLYGGRVYAIDVPLNELGTFQGLLWEAGRFFRVEGDGSLTPLGTR